MAGDLQIGKAEMGPRLLEATGGSPTELDVALQHLRACLRHDVEQILADLLIAEEKRLATVSEVAEAMAKLPELIGKLEAIETTLSMGWWQKLLRALGRKG